MAGVEPTREFLEGAKELAHENGSLLVFDEMFTGFRLATGGAQDYYGVVPDIAAFGKAMANGFPIAAVVSRKDILEGCPELIISSTSEGRADRERNYLTIFHEKRVEGMLLAPVIPRIFLYYRRTGTGRIPGSISDSTGGPPQDPSGNG